MSAFDDSGITPKEYESNEKGKINGVIIKEKNNLHDNYQKSICKMQIAALFFSVFSLVLSCLSILFFHFCDFKIIYAGNVKWRKLLLAASILMGILSLVPIIIAGIGVSSRKEKISRYYISITFISLVLFSLNLIIKIFIN